MANQTGRSVRLDVVGLFAAGLINTFLAPLVAAVVFGPGTLAREPDLLARAAWIVDQPLRWGGGWLFWFPVTLSFAWSYYALGRHLEGRRSWRSLAIGLALIAGAVDLVGVLVNLVVLPEIAQGLANALAGPDPALTVAFRAMERLSNALVNVTAFGLYSAAGLLLLPALWATADYPRRLGWLGAALWGLSAVASLLLAFAPSIATGPMLVGFALYAPWVWASGAWVWRRAANGS